MNFRNFIFLKTSLQIELILSHFMGTPNKKGNRNNLGFECYELQIPL